MVFERAAANLLCSTITDKGRRWGDITVPEFGTRASFRLELRGRLSHLLRRWGVARELLTYYRKSDIVAVTGISEPRPSTASAMTPWAGRFRVRTLRVPEVI